jgi:predicted phage-related endonuclease
MTERNYDLNAWFETYQDTFASITKAQQDGLRALERFARFNYAVAGDVLDAGLAQTRAALGVRASAGTQVIAELLQKQSEIGAQLNEKMKARAQEFSSLAAEVQQSVGSFAAETANRASATAGARKAA